VFVRYNLAFQGDDSPVFAIHSKNFSLENSLSVGVDRMQRNFEPMQGQVENWEVPKHLARRLHELYFSPQNAEFESTNHVESLECLTSAFKELDPIPLFRATAKLARFLEATNGQPLRVC
jgi:hypothetical protein